MRTIDPHLTLEWRRPIPIPACKGSEARAWAAKLEVKANLKDHTELKADKMPLRVNGVVGRSTSNSN